VAVRLAVCGSVLGSVRHSCSAAVCGSAAVVCCSAAECGSTAVYGSAAVVCGSAAECGSVAARVAVRAAVCDSAYGSVRAVHAVVCGNALGGVWQCARQCEAVRQCAAVYVNARGCVRQCAQAVCGSM
jgi:hypothetical protein